MKRLLELGNHVEDLSSIVPSVAFTDAGKTITIKFGVKFLDCQESDPKLDHLSEVSPMILIEKNGDNLYSSGLSVSMFRLPSEGLQMEIFMKLTPKVPSRETAFHDENFQGDS